MLIKYTGQPLVSSASLAITLRIEGPVRPADQRTIRHRLGVIRQELGIAFMTPQFDHAQIHMIPKPPSRKGIFPRQIKAILARLEVPADLGFAINGNA